MSHPSSCEPSAAVGAAVSTNVPIRLFERSTFSWLWVPKNETMKAGMQRFCIYTNFSIFRSEVINLTFVNPCRLPKFVIRKGHRHRQRLLFIRSTVVCLHDSVHDYCVLWGHNTGSENVVHNHAFYSLSLWSHMRVVSKNTLDSYKAWQSGIINVSSLKKNKKINCRKWAILSN